jgi:hypothetical protein
MRVDRVKDRKCENRAEKDEYVGKSLEVMNKFREAVGMRKLEPMTRQCLRCGKTFMSYSLNNRMCGCARE